MEPRGEGFTTEPHLSLYFILWDIDFVWLGQLCCRTQEIKSSDKGFLWICFLVVPLYLVLLLRFSTNQMNL
jgi:hypothetical protein